MLKINLITIGTIKEQFFKDAIDEYKKRISRFAKLEIVELKEKPTLDDEASDIILKLKGYKFAMCVEGTIISSEELASKIKKISVEGTSEISFVIGSSNGLSDKVKTICDEKISFGRVTFPHQLMRVILTEQIYRAMTINNNITYHK